MLVNYRLGRELTYLDLDREFQDLDLDALRHEGVNTVIQNLIMGRVVLTCTALGLRGLVAAITNAARVLD